MGNDYSLLCATQNGYFYRYSVDDTLKTYKLLSEHSLKNTDSDLHKQQETKIYKTKKEEENDDEQKKEQLNEQPKVVEIVDNDNQNNQAEDIAAQENEDEEDAQEG